MANEDSFKSLRNLHYTSKKMMIAKDKRYVKFMENLSETEWDFVEKQETKKFIWWNPKDWIPKYFREQ